MHEQHRLLMRLVTVGVKAPASPFPGKVDVGVFVPPVELRIANRAWQRRLDPHSSPPFTSAAISAAIGSSWVPFFDTRAALEVTQAVLDSSSQAWSLAKRGKGRIVVGPLPEESLFGRWLRRRRKALDLTQNGLAQKAGCSVSTIRKLEADVRHPSRLLAAELAEILGVAVEERPAFIRFAKQGWADQPTSPTESGAVRPWLPGQGASTSAGGFETHREDVAAVEVSDDDLGDAPLYGRSSELAELERHMTAALNGRGGVVFVVGDAGQGKTAILRALTARALASDPSVLVTTGSCNAYTGTGDPFLLFRDVLEELIGVRRPDVNAVPLERVRIARLRLFGSIASKILLDTGPSLFGAILDARRFRSGAVGVGAKGRPTIGYPERPEFAWPGVPSPSGRQTALRSEVVRSLHHVANEVPLVLVLDDLQWIDRSSAELLMFLATKIRGHRLFVVAALRTLATARPGSNAFAHGLLDELAGTQGVPIIDLDASEGRSFVEELLDAEPNDLDPDFREALWRQTAGHPLFTNELLRAMRERGDLVQDGDGSWFASSDLRWDQLPDRVAGVVASRVARVGPFAGEVLRAASAMGETFTAEVVASVVKRDASDVVSVLDDELVRGHHLVDSVRVERGPTGLLSHYRFRHILIQQHVYREIGDGLKSYLHEAVAAATEIALAEDADPLALASQWMAAKLPARAVPYLRQAGERAMRAGAVTEAIERFTAALEHAEEMDPLTRAGLLHDLGECHHWRTDRPAALQALEKARALFLENGDVRSAGAVVATMGAVLWEQRDVAHALEVTEAAIASLDIGPETPELVQVLVTLAMIQHVYSREADALSHARRALDVATRVGSDDARMRALVLVGTVLASTDPARHDEGLAMVEEAMRIAERQGAVEWASLAANQLAARLRALGRFEEAVERLHMAIAYAEQHALPQTELWAWSELWSHRWQRGEWDAALPQLPRLRGYVDGGGTYEMLRARALVVFASAHVDLGLVREAQAVLETHAHALERVDEPQVRVPYLRECLRIAALQRDDAVADWHAFRMVEQVAGRVTHSEEVPVPIVTACHWLAGRPSRDASVGLEQCLAALAQTEAQFGSELTRAAHMEGRAAKAGGEGRATEAAELFEAAAVSWRSCGFPLEEARALASAAMWFETSQAKEEAKALRLQSDRILRALQDQLPAPELRTSFNKVRESMNHGHTW